MDEQLTFGELNEGDRFIAFPIPGDNQGHGGFKGIHYVFMKVQGPFGGDNSVKLSTGVLSRMSALMPVILVQ